MKSTVRIRSVDESERPMLKSTTPQLGGAVAQLGARLDGIEEVVGSNPIGSTKLLKVRPGHIGSSSYRTHGSLARGLIQA